MNWWILPIPDDNVQRCWTITDCFELLWYRVFKKVQLSVTDAVLVRNWQHFLGIWKTTFAVQNTTFERTFINVIGRTLNIGKQVWSQKCFCHSILLAKTNIFDQVFVQNLCKNQKKIITQKWLMKLKSWRKLNQSRIKFYNMWPFKIQI